MRALNFRRFLSASFLGASILFVGVSQARADSYSVTEIAGNGSFGYALNASGEAAGFLFFKTQPITYHTFFYSNGTTTDLGPLGARSSVGMALNGAGQIARYLTITGGVEHAFVYSNGIATDLGTFGGTSSFATGINSSGQVTGYAETTSGIFGFIYNNGVMTKIPTPGAGDSAGNAINDAGQVAGDYAGRGFIYSNGVLTQLGTLGGNGSSAQAINASGQVAGYSLLSNGIFHAYMYSNGTMTDLGSLGGNSYAYALNDLGEVVGSTDAASSQGDAFIYRNGTMTNLNSLIGSSGVSLWRASGINDAGQIIANGFDSSGVSGTFLLTPLPLPSSVWAGLALLGLLGINQLRLWRAKAKASIHLAGPYFE